MRLLNRSSPLTIVALLGALFSPNPADVAAAVTITKAMLVDKTNGGEVFSGMADADLSVDFVAQANTDCDDTNLTYTWDFGDGNTAVGQNVSHVYGIAGGGNRSPKLTVTDNCGGSAVRENTLSVFVITGIEITQIGDQANPTTNGRLCFDTVRNVAGSALPAGVTGSWRIDWHVQIGTANSNLANSQNGDLPTFVNWPTSNSSWGPNTLFASIDGTSVPGQNGEMILTGTPSIVYASKSIKVFFEMMGTQNPSLAASDPKNWFYYWTQTSANEGTMTYGATNECLWDAPTYTCVLSDAYKVSYPTPTVGQNANSTLTYIDAFAWGARHEWRHHNQKVAWWGAGGYVAARDLDSDAIPFDFEVLLTAADGGPFDPTITDTFPGDGNLVNDHERNAVVTQSPWTVGSADSEDWAHPGNQWNP